MAVRQQPKLPRVLDGQREALKFALDSTVWLMGLSFAVWARYEFAPSEVQFGKLGPLLPLAVLGQFAAGWLLGLYRGRYRYGSFDETAPLAAAVSATTAMVVLANDALPGQRHVPMGAAVLSGGVVLAGCAGIRHVFRLVRERGMRPAHPRQRVLVFGAGEGGAQSIVAMLRNPDSPYVPVGLLDDDPSKRHRRLSGVAVMGRRDDLASVARAVQADSLLVAIPSATSDLIGDIGRLAHEAGLPVMVLPTMSELVGLPVGVEDIRPVSPADLLGRRQVQTDLTAIAGYVGGHRVLVTGAGGSIGSELCRQLSQLGPAELIMLDRDESALHAVQLSIEGRALLDSPDLVLLDIRDDGGLQRLFAERRPQVVFHAAALKHLPLLERHPSEAVRTNVWGTGAVLHAAAAHGVERFVNISTDKAANPTSVLGYSKRVGERLTSAMARRTGRPYVSVRFGNVLGSRGSMLETFQHQVDEGGPVTVTDPDVTRYFMTVEEAVQLVIQAGAIGEGGEVLVLDMGEQVRIVDVAQMLISRSERPVEVVFTGLRPGEKLHEDLLGDGEGAIRRAHPLIDHVVVPPLDLHSIDALDPASPADSTTCLLRDLAVIISPDDLVDVALTSRT